MLRPIPLGWVALFVLACAFDADATVTDEGQVSVGSDGSLTIGADAFGQRTLVGEADGPYPTANLGALTGGHGELVLSDGAAFTATGQLTIGGQGGAVLGVSSGSQLLTGSARLLDSDLFPSTYLVDPIEAHITGSDSTWINAGLLQVGEFGVYAPVSLKVSSGGHLQTNGVLATGADVELARTDILVSGTDTSWANTGGLALTDAHFTVSDGATATDAGVGLSGLSSGARAIVQGAGSIWRTGEMGIATDGEALLIREGGRVESTSVGLSTQQRQHVTVSGAGSAWMIDGTLRVIANDAGGDSRVTIEDGGLVEATTTQIGIAGGGSGWVSLSGTGSRLRNNGELLLAGNHSVLARFDLLDGAEVTTGTLRALCGNEGFGPYDDGCEIRVEGAGSLLSVLGTALFQADLPGGGGRWTVGSGGRVEVGQAFTVAGAAKLALAGGTVSTPRLVLQGGALAGNGAVQGDVENAGLLAPGAPIGRLTVDGSYRQDADGVLSITLGGLVAGVSYDLLEVLGASVLGGELHVGLAEGYMPNPGDAFLVLSAGSLAGAFDQYEGLELSTDRALRVEYLSNGVRLVTVPEPVPAAFVIFGVLAMAVLQPRAPTWRPAPGDRRTRAS